MSDDRGNAGRPSSERGALPRAIGHYPIVSKLGEGGMGIVYEAEQQEPRRRVALKVVRGGELLDETRIRLFQREAEALARLKHPGIAAIYESGCTQDGQHFFVMELVGGVPLGEYLARRPPPGAPGEIEHRLRVFLQVCDAVHYAHQRGVIHRDLKPSNVLVSEEGSASSARSGPRAQVKVLDFGLARLTESDARPLTISAEVGLIRGTLQYMSPEQALGTPDAIDVRTDVYALGVILYEMLSGKRPYDVGGAGLLEAVRIVREARPVPLRAAQRAVDADLETIVRKALEKETDRRYSSAAALADDVERRLTSQPILARPPSALYQIRKFAARNRVLVGGAVVFVVLLAGSAIVATTFGVREARARRAVERTEADLVQVAQFQSDMLSSVDVEAMGRRLLANLRRRSGGDEPAAAFDRAMENVNPTDVARDVLDEDVLARAAQSIETTFGEQPLVAATLEETLAATYAAIGRREQAEPLARRSLETREASLGRTDPRTVDSIATCARVAHLRGRFEEAVGLQTEVVDALRSRLGEEDRETLYAQLALGTTLSEWGKHGEARRILEPTVETMRRVLGAEDRDALEGARRLASAYCREERFDLAEPIVRSVLDATSRRFGPDDSHTRSLISVLGNILFGTDRLEEAEALYKDLVAADRRVYGSDHPTTLVSMDQLATTYSKLGRHSEALDLLREVEAAQRRVLGPDHNESLSARNNIAVVLENLGRDEEAERIYREVIEARNRSLGPGNPRCLRTMKNLAQMLLRQKRIDEAEATMKEGLAAARATTLGDSGYEAMELARMLRRLYFELGRFADALPVVERLADNNRRLLGPDADETLASTADVASMNMLTGNLDRADEIYAAVLAGQERTLGPNGERPVLTRYNIACLRVRQGRKEDAIGMLQGALDRGYKHGDILTDPDMNPLRDDPRFEAMVNEVKRRRGSP